jgi:RNA polymerase sigma-70 factor (ECF subfamily)
LKNAQNAPFHLSTRALANPKYAGQGPLYRGTCLATVDLTRLCIAVGLRPLGDALGPRNPSLIRADSGLNTSFPSEFPDAATVIGPDFASLAPERNFSELNLKAIMEGNGCRKKESKSDADLMRALAKKDSGAIEEIYRRYEPILRTVILGVLHEETDADDVLHDVLLQLWNNADRLVPEKGLHGFLVTMARRRALDRLRRRLAYRRVTDKFECELKAEFKNELRCSEPQAANTDRSEVLQGMIKELPEPQQEVIQLTFFEGMSQREIAARRSIALGTVKTRLQLAQKKLLHRLMLVQGEI